MKNIKVWIGVLVVMVVIGLYNSGRDETPTPAAAEAPPPPTSKPYIKPHTPIWSGEVTSSPAPVTTPAPTPEPTPAPVATESSEPGPSVHVEFEDDDDRKSRFCRRHWFC